jgi:CheY-like chemotaxis protein
VVLATAQTNCHNKNSCYSSNVSVPRILIVEDNASDVDLLRLALTEQGQDFELSVCVDGQQALDFVREQRKALDELKPCVVLLDLNLPKHTGLEVLRAIRQDRATQHIGVIVLTGAVRPRDAEEIRSLGAHCRPKPNVLAELTGLAREIMAMCNGEHASV